MTVYLSISSADLLRSSRKKLTCKEDSILWRAASSIDGIIAHLLHLDQSIGIIQEWLIPTTCVNSCRDKVTSQLSLSYSASLEESTPTETPESTTQNLQSSFAIVCQTQVGAALQDLCLPQLCLLVLHPLWDLLAHCAHLHQWLAHPQLAHPQLENHLLNFATPHLQDVVPCFMFVKKMNLSKVLKKWSKLKTKLRVKRLASPTSQISISAMPSKFSTQDDVDGLPPLI